MEKFMDDQQQMMEAQSELEYELTTIFEDLEEGNMLTVAQIDTLRYACGFPKKTRVIPLLAETFDEFRNIFGGKK
jgi:hypothetical protein